MGCDRAATCALNYSAPPGTDVDFGYCDLHARTLGVDGYPPARGAGQHTVATMAAAALAKETA
jgi:hypothetical protein